MITIAVNEAEIFAVENTEGRELSNDPTRRRMVYLATTTKYKGRNISKQGGEMKMKKTEKQTTTVATFYPGLMTNTTLFLFENGLLSYG